MKQKLKIKSILFVVFISIFISLGVFAIFNSNFFSESNSVSANISSEVIHVQNTNTSDVHGSENLPINLWSDTAYWATKNLNDSTNGLPNQNTHVVINEDERVVIDFDGAQAKNIISRGTLEFQENPNGDSVSLDTGWILVDGGVLKAGSETNPFQDVLTITLPNYDDAANLEFNGLTLTKAEYEEQRTNGTFVDNRRKLDSNGNLGQTGRITCHGHMIPIDFGNHFIGVYSGVHMDHGMDPSLMDDYNNISSRNPDPQNDPCIADTLSGSVGKISLHGNTDKTEWTYLERTALPGENSILVSDTSGWSVGDRIAITSTDYDHRQAHDAQITSINGNEVEFDQDLVYMHYGDFVEGGVDQRAEVANLTRNIVIRSDQSDKNKTTDGITNEFFRILFDPSVPEARREKVTYDELRINRGHVIIGNQSNAFIDGVEFKDLGQEGVLGKYPLHFHHGMDMAGSYVKNSSIHGSLNKCLTLHLTNNMLIQNNIGYNTVGHCMYLESDEDWPNRTPEQKALRSRNNVFQNNLAFDITKPLDKQRTKGYDDTVSSFWITDLSNQYIDNVAGGAGDADGAYPGEVGKKTSQDGGHGFYVENRKTNDDDVFIFTGNKSHSNSQTGFWKNEIKNTLVNSMEITNFTSHHNRLSNFWIRHNGVANVFDTNESLTVRDSYFADSLNGIYIASNGALQNYSKAYVIDSVFVGESSNKGTPVTSNNDDISIFGLDDALTGDDDLSANTTDSAIYDEVVGLDGRTVPLNKVVLPYHRFVPGDNRGLRGIRAIELYDGPTYYEGNTFINYEPNSQREASAFTLSYDTMYQQHPDTSATDNTFINTKPVYWQREFIRSGSDGIILNDLDGSMTGTAGSMITGKNSLISEGCDYSQDWNAFICSPSQKKDVVMFHLESEAKENKHISYLTLQNSQGLTVRADRAIGNTDFSANILPNDWYTWTKTDYYGSDADNPRDRFSKFRKLEYDEMVDYQVMVKHMLRNDDFVGFKFPSPTVPENIYFNRDLQGNGGQILEVFSKEDIENSPQTAYYYSYEEEMLYVKAYPNNIVDDFNKHWNASIFIEVEHPEPNVVEGVAKTYISSTEGVASNVLRDTMICSIDTTPTKGTLEIDPYDERKLKYTASDTGSDTFTYTPCLYNESSSLNSNGEIITSRIPGKELSSVTETFEVIPQNTPPRIPTRTISTDSNNTLGNGFRIVVNDIENNFDLTDGVSSFEIVKNVNTSLGVINIVNQSTIQFAPISDQVTGKSDFLVKACDDLKSCIIKELELNVTGPISISNPQEYQVVQRYSRGTNNFGDIVIEGKLRSGTNCNSLEASFGGNSFANLRQQSIDNTTFEFKGVLVEQNIGRSDLIVRCKNDPSIEVTVPNVGVGDVFVVAGQSNAEGHGEVEQKYQDITGTNVQNFPSVFDEYDRWKIGNDSTDRGGKIGSVWPIVGGYIAKEKNVPVAFITTAKGSTDLVDSSAQVSDWEDPKNNSNTVNCISRRATTDTSNPEPNCFQNMLNQINESQVNGYAAILWFQGEEDVNNQTTTTEYAQALRGFYNGVRQDVIRKRNDARSTNPSNYNPLLGRLGFPKLVVGVIGPVGPQNQNNLDLDNVRFGIMNAWNSPTSPTPHTIFKGPQTYDIEIQNDNTGDNLHFTTNDELETLGYRWWRTLNRYFYQGGGTPSLEVKSILVPTNRSGDDELNKIGIRFSRKLNADSVDSSLFRVREGGQNINIKELSIRNNYIELFLGDENSDYIINNPDNVRVSYALGNFAQGKDVVRENQDIDPDSGDKYIPADPFRNLPVGFELPTRVSVSGSTSNTTNTNGFGLRTQELKELIDPIIIEVSNNIFIKEGIEEFTQIENLPSGITPFIEVIDDNKLEIKFVGEDTDFDSSDEVDNVSITFNPEAFEEEKIFDDYEDTIIENIALKFNNGASDVDADSDNDGVSDSIENDSPNNGDANGDGIQDSQQSNVSSDFSNEINAYKTLVVDNDCNIISQFATTSINEAGVSDGGFEYPLGLVDFDLTCSQNGGDANITIIYDKVYDTTNWIFRKYKYQNFTDISDAVTYNTQTIGGIEKTTVNYRIIDGSNLDADGSINGVIEDPAGPAEQITQDTDNSNSNNGNQNDDNNQNNNQSNENTSQGNQNNQENNNQENSNNGVNQLVRTGGPTLYVSIIVLMVVSGLGGYFLANVKTLKKN